MVLDNYATHKTRKFWRGSADPRTPCHSLHAQFLANQWSVVRLTVTSQINEVRTTGVRELESAILEFIEAHNEQPKPCVDQECRSFSQHWTVRFPTLAAHGTNNMQKSVIRR